MSKATLLFTGPSLPYHVLDYAISWARENEGKLRTLFIVPGRLPEEGYPFPNDLDDAEKMTTEVESEKGIKDIIQQEIRYIEKRCNASHIPVQSEIMFSPTLQQVVAKLNDSDVIFIDKNAGENEDDMSHLPYSLEEILEKSSRHFVSVGEMDRYSDVFY